MHTLPLLLLLCFNPIIAYHAKHLPNCGFQMTIQIPESVGLPPVGSHIYAEWREEASDEPERWYHCSVEESAQRPKQVKSESHSVNAYADDVTLFSTSKEAHQTVLLELDEKCSEIGLQIHPDKCVSYAFNGQKICCVTTFKFQQGSTKNITFAPSKFLGQTLGANSRSTRSLYPPKNHRESIFSPKSDQPETYQRGI